MVCFNQRAVTNISTVGKDRPIMYFASIGSLWPMARVKGIGLFLVFSNVISKKSIKTLIPHIKLLLTP